MKLLFMDQDDVSQTFGRLQFGAHALREWGPKVSNQPTRREGEPSAPQGPVEGIPERTILEVIRPTGDGMFECLGWQTSDDTSWRIVRCTTGDLNCFPQLDVVHEEPAGGDIQWLGMTCMATGGDGTVWLWKWARGEPGHALYAYSSEDGLQWRRAQEGPVFHDHDSNYIMWDERTAQFIDYQATYQSWNKRYPDNIGQDIRRVTHIRTSRDGLHWEPPEDVGSGGPHMPDECLMTPDGDDPEELEFYRLQAFPYGDRYVGMQLNYAPSPQEANPNMKERDSKHGPQLGTEWWISRDGFSWQRPHRELHASGPAPGHLWHPPLHVDGRWQFLIGTGWYGYEEDRLFYVASRANAEFSTVAFEMPNTPLRLNADTSWPETQHTHFARQGYVMAELLDANGRQIEGYERSQCTFLDADSPDFALQWNERDGTELAGKQVRLRFYLRSARIYAVTAE